MTTDTRLKNIFGSILTAEAPASLYRGEMEGNRTPLQKLRYPNGKQYTVISAEAIRNRLREMLRDDLPKVINRSRVKLGAKNNRSLGEQEGEEVNQLTVHYRELPNRLRFADDLLFGFLMLDKNKIAEASEIQGASMLRVNYAVSLEPFVHDKTMHQSPKIIGAFTNAEKSAPIEREVHVTAYQYPFGMNLNDLRLQGREAGEGDADEATRKHWVANLLKAIGELSFVAGNPARTFYPFAPVSIVLRLTERRTPDFDLYGFSGNHQELIEAIKDGQLPADQFYIGGRITKENDDLRKLVYPSDSKSNSPETSSSEAVGGKLNKQYLFKTAAAAIEKLIQDAGLNTKTSKGQSGEVE